MTTGGKSSGVNTLGSVGQGTWASGHVLNVGILFLVAPTSLKWCGPTRARNPGGLGSPNQGADSRARLAFEPTGGDQPNNHTCMRVYFHLVFGPRIKTG
jgi:hypothetical protein